MKRTALVFCLVALPALLFLTYAYWPAKPANYPPGKKDDPTPPVVASTNGLDTAQRQEFYHLAEGSEVYPLDWLRALENSTTKKPFLDDIDRFGLLADPDNPDKLPIGLTASLTRGMEPLGKMVGLNCAACHVGELTYQGNRVRLDGAPNLFNTRLFFAELVDSALVTASDANKLLAFLARLRQGRADQQAGGKPSKVGQAARKLVGYFTDKGEDALARALAPVVKKLIDTENALPPQDLKATVNLDAKGNPGEFRNSLLKEFVVADLKPFLEKSKFLQVPLEGLEQLADREESLLNSLQDIFITLRLLRARAVFLKRLGPVGKDEKTNWGPGRVDAFGSARTFLFQPDYKPYNPVSYPHLWGMNNLDWFHYDNNTTTLLERNFGQALGVGAVYDPKTYASTLQTMNLHRLEVLARQITPPAWPEKIFGTIDKKSVERGAELFETHCARCHPAVDDKSKVPDLLYDLQEIGTDPGRATMFGEKLPADAVEPFQNMAFDDAIGLAMKKIKEKSFEELTPEQRDVFTKDPVAKWRAPGKYAGRPLVAIWAAAPYLHNGSVPTLDDLLRPAVQRPKTFPLGQREFDPIKLGYVTEVKGAPVFLFDTAQPGNANIGHEYGTTLTDAQRKDLLEYLKAY